MSGGGGSAGLKSDPRGVEMDERGVGGQVQDFDRLRQQQQRRRRRQHRIRERDNRADRARIVRLPVGLVAGWRLLLCGGTDRIRGDKAIFLTP